VEIDEVDTPDEGTEEIDSSLQDHSPERVLTWINELPDNQRMVLNMYAIDGLSHQDIANALNTTVSNTKSILSRARKALRNKIQSQA
jgi:RNA polymerase sigma-70 factor (ECF subfamily)